MAVVVEPVAGILYVGVGGEELRYGRVVYTAVHLDEVKLIKMLVHGVATLEIKSCRSIGSLRPICRVYTLAPWVVGIACKHMTRVVSQCYQRTLGIVVAMIERVNI